MSSGLHWAHNSIKCSHSLDKGGQVVLSVNSHWRGHILILHEIAIYLCVQNEFNCSSVLILTLYIILVVVTHKQTVNFRGAPSVTGAYGQGIRLDWLV
jgi:hypothetical protein